MQRKYLITILSIVIILCIGAACFYKYELNINKNAKPIASDSSKNAVQSNPKPIADTSNNNTINSNESSNNKTIQPNTNKVTKQNNLDKSSKNNNLSQIQSSSNNTDSNISEKVKDYILNGQQNMSEAQKIKWSKTFLDQVDIKDLYKKYTANGGNANDIQNFAKYITANAPIQNNWQDMFKKDAYNTYKQKIVKLEYLSDDLYQAYIEQNGAEVPFVVVSSRTGYFHG